MMKDTAADGGEDAPARPRKSRRSQYLTPEAWIDSLEVGGPYDIPTGLSLNSVRAMAHRAEGKTFSFRKPSSFRPPQAYRTDDGVRPAVPVKTMETMPKPSKHRSKTPKPKPVRQTVEQKIMALSIGQSLSLEKNEYAVRNKAKAVTQTTGRQFSVDVTPGGKVLTRRG